MIVRAAWCPLCRMGTWQAQYDAVGEWAMPVFVANGDSDPTSCRTCPTCSQT
jgi:hypothetical protein